MNNGNKRFKRCKHNKIDSKESKISKRKRDSVPVKKINLRKDLDKIFKKKDKNLSSTHSKVK